MRDSVLVAANWVEHMLTGSLALAVATIAVAMLGLAVMSGRVTTRRGLEVVLGIFLIFGAPVISAGLLRARPVEVGPAAPSLPRPGAVTTAPPRASVYDPYAGASVPSMQMRSGDLAPMQ
jgi:TrbC/VIRB2 pilin